MATDNLLKAYTIIQELWNERKSLQYLHNTTDKSKERCLKRMRKLVADLREVDLESELAFLEKYIH